MPLFLTEIVLSKRNYTIVLCLKCRRCSTEYLVAQTLRTITGSICLTIGTFPFLKEFAGCRISDKPKGMLKLCHFVCSALLTIFLTLSTALLLESGGVSAFCLSLILHFFWHSLLHIGPLNMLVSLRVAANLWIKDVSTKTINPWYAWCWSCKRWELMKLSNSSFKHHRQDIVPPVLAASHRQTAKPTVTTCHHPSHPTFPSPFIDPNYLQVITQEWQCGCINRQFFLTK